MIGFVLWAEAVTRELRAAGFVVESHDGYPSVHTESNRWDNYRLIDFRPVVRADKFLVGGTRVLFVPHGTAHAGLPL